MPECPFVDHGMTIRSDGMVDPCCAWRNIDEPYTLYTNEDAWKSKFARIKEGLKDGWPSGCIECKTGEESGKTSMRSRAIKERQFDNAEGIEYWDFKLSVTCNLACKMCGAHSSSTWRRDAFKYKEIAYSFHGDGKGKAKAFKEQDGLDIEYFYPHLLNAKVVKFTGGEPFLIPEVRKCVEYLVDSEAARNIRLHFITNGTQELDSWIDLFKEFKHVHLTVSVDAIEELYEYIRHGASWEQVSNNLIKIRDIELPNLKLVVTPLPMALNYGRMHEIKEWCDANRIESNESIECISPAIMSPKAVNNPELKIKLIEHLKMIDRIYGTDYKKVCPHLVDNNE